MQPQRLAVNTRKPIMGEEAQFAIRTGVELTHEVAKASYGPDSGDVAIEAQFGAPIVSHDGVFNLDHLHIPDPGPNMAIEILVQASRSTNVHVGDGTTAAAILATSIYKEAAAIVAATREPRMAIAKRIRQAGAQAIEHIEKLKIEADKRLLENVAIISAADEATGQLVSDTIQEIGADGGVIIENFGGSGMHNDIVSGFYFRRGFTDAALLNDPSNLESRFNNKVFVMVCERELSGVNDIGPILDACMDANIRELILIGNVSGEALALAVKLRLEHLQTGGKEGMVCTIVDAPDYGAMRTLFMDDVALYTGAEVLSGGSNPNDFDPKMLGAAKAVVNEFSTTFFDGERNEAQEKALQARIDELTEQLKVSSSPIEQEALRARLGRLSGRIAILRVGGNSEVEQQNARLHVEDAVAALQAAIKDGVVPGGGVTLARLPDDIDFKQAFEQPFKALMNNGGHNPEKALWKVQEAKDWMGYDLRQGTSKLVNLKDAGVVDPTLVIKEVVNNACSVAAELVKMTVLLPFDNREAKRG